MLRRNIFSNLSQTSSSAASAIVVGCGVTGVGCHHRLFSCDSSSNFGGGGGPSAFTTIRGGRQICCSGARAAVSGGSSGGIIGASSLCPDHFAAPVLMPSSSSSAFPPSSQDQHQHHSHPPSWSLAPSSSSSSPLLHHYYNDDDPTMLMMRSAAVVVNMNNNNTTTMSSNTSGSGSGVSSNSSSVAVVVNNARRAMATSNSPLPTADMMAGAIGSSSSPSSAAKKAKSHDDVTEREDHQQDEQMAAASSVGDEDDEAFLEQQQQQFIESLPPYTDGMMADISALPIHHRHSRGGGRKASRRDGEVDETASHGGGGRNLGSSGAEKIYSSAIPKRKKIQLKEARKALDRHGIRSAINDVLDGDADDGDDADVGHQQQQQHRRGNVSNLIDEARAAASHQNRRGGGGGGGSSNHSGATTPSSPTVVGTPPPRPRTKHHHPPALGARRVDTPEYFNKHVLHNTDGSIDGELRAMASFGLTTPEGDKITFTSNDIPIMPGAAAASRRRGGSDRRIRRDDDDDYTDHSGAAVAGGEEEIYEVNFDTALHKKRFGLKDAKDPEEDDNPYRFLAGDGGNSHHARHFPHHLNHHHHHHHRETSSSLSGGAAIPQQQHTLTAQRVARDGTVRAPIRSTHAADGSDEAPIPLPDAVAASFAVNGRAQLLNIASSVEDIKVLTKATRDELRRRNMTADEMEEAVLKGEVPTTTGGPSPSPSAAASAEVEAISSAPPHRHTLILDNNHVTKKKTAAAGNNNSIFGTEIPLTRSFEDAMHEHRADSRADAAMATAGGHYQTHHQRLPTSLENNAFLSEAEKKFLAEQSDEEFLLSNNPNRNAPTLSATSYGNVLSNVPGLVDGVQQRNGSGEVKFSPDATHRWWMDQHKKKWKVGGMGRWTRDASNRGAIKHSSQ